MGEEMNILFLSPEAAPFSKTGGLADVAGSLPGALARQGAEVLVVVPLYRVTREKDLDLRPAGLSLRVELGLQTLAVNVYETEVEDRLKVCFIEREDMFDRPNLYGNAWGDYYDNLERFSLYGHAALKLAEALSFRPHVIHCHDWQTGLVPPLVKGPYGSSVAVGRVPTVFTIHNIGYQGLFPTEKLGVTALSGADVYHPEGLEYWGNISLLKAGIVYATAVTTVSPRYSREIQTHEYGRGMEGVLQPQGKGPPWDPQRRGLWGVGPCHGPAHPLQLQPSPHERQGPLQGLAHGGDGHRPCISGEAASCHDLTPRHAERARSPA